MTSASSHQDCMIIRIGGMTCASCELLLERKLKGIPGIRHADVNHKKGTARLTLQGKESPDGARIAAVLQAAGYSLMDGGSPTLSSLPPDKRKWMEIGGSLLVILAVFMILQTFDLVSLAPSTSGALSLGGVFLIGLVAGTSSCLAVTGGLLLALAARHNEMHQAETAWQKFKPLLHFNTGRILSYFVLGGLVGVLGQSITLSTRMSGFLTVIVAFVMLSLALSILEILPKRGFFLRPPKKLSRWIASLSESDHPGAPFALGALTFFLPCGFTQSLQLAALASGDFVTGAMTMGMFALGTLPSLLGISAVSSTARGSFSRIFLRFSGTLVLLLALFNLQSGFALTGIDLSGAFAGPAEQNFTPVPADSATVQEVSMAVTAYGYAPDTLTIRAGVPVRWRVDGSGASGCTSVLTIPELGVSQALGRGENIIEFTAPKKGRLAFMCSMGMVRGSFTVL